MSESYSASYAAAGVDITAGYRADRKSTRLNSSHD